MEQSKQLAPGNENLSQLEHVNTQFDARIPQGISVQDILVPEFWAHHANRLRPFDEIRARSEDGTWVAYLLVTDSARTWARVHILSQHSLTPATGSADELKACIESHEVKFRGPHKWSVVRKADSVVVTEGIEKKEDAVSWLDNHARNIVGVQKAA